MASPIMEGTLSSSAFSSRDIDILKEKIYLKIDRDFSTAFYQIEYLIKTDTGGKQIPLLFHAKDYMGDFKIWVDNQEVKWFNIPSDYRSIANTPFEKFSNSFKEPYRDGEPETVDIFWQENLGTVYEINDLKYFETDLSKGEHRIRVEYTGRAWFDRSDWVNKYSFRYSLSPAKYWKSFGSLEITIDASDFNSSLTTNLGQPTNGRLDSVSVWNFSKLPDDYFEIIHTPEISAFAKTLIAINPFGLTLIFALPIALLHLFLIKKYRKSHPTKKHSSVVTVGSLIIPFLILIGYIVSFYIIDLAIGPEAGKYHGYNFLVIIFYPLLLPIYWTIMWLADRKIKGKINNPV
jgi:hypothetical protein